MLPGLRMALAAFFATTLLIGVGFVSIGLLVSARQDSGLALAPAKDPWRNALRPMVDEPVSLMTATVAEPVVEPPAVADPEPAVPPSPPKQASLDGTPIAEAAAADAAVKEQVQAICRRIARRNWI